MARRKDHPFRAVFRTDHSGWPRFKNEGKGFGHVGAMHKGKVEEVPHRFANELVCGHIAQFLRLPIPPFALSHFDGQEGVDVPHQAMFSSVDFNYERESDPLVDFDILMEKKAEDCAGILAFDILVANPDRRKDHIWCDNPGNPNRILILDHDYALFGGENEGIDRLNEFEDKLGLRFLGVCPRLVSPQRGNFETLGAVE